MISKILSSTFSILVYHVLYFYYIFYHLCTIISIPIEKQQQQLTYASLKAFLANELSNCSGQIAIVRCQKLLVDESIGESHRGQLLELLRPLEHRRGCWCLRGKLRGRQHNADTCGRGSGSWGRLHRHNNGCGCGCGCGCAVY